jgi:hypothetical protein
MSAPVGKRDPSTWFPHPSRPGKHIDPDTGILPIAEWGNECKRGFVSNVRFRQGTEPVIERTNRDVTRAWRRAGEETQKGKPQ